MRPACGGDSTRSYSGACRSHGMSAFRRNPKHDNRSARRHAPVPGSVGRSAESADSDGNTRPWRSAACGNHRPGTPRLCCDTLAPGSGDHADGPAGSVSDNIPMFGLPGHTPGHDRFRSCLRKRSDPYSSEFLYEISTPDPMPEDYRNPLSRQIYSNSNAMPFGGVSTTSRGFRTMQPSSYKPITYEY